MKRLVLSASVLASALAFAAAPKVTELEFSQDASTGLATVSFSLAGEAVVTFDVQTNGVSIGWQNFRASTTGCAFGKVNPAGDYTLTWDVYGGWGADQKKIPVGGIKAVITAWSPDNTPDFMDIDLTAKSNVTYYVSEDDLPCEVTDARYKTTHLLMKRIHAANVEWTMGSPATEKGRATTATRWENQRNVVFSADYYIGVFETTQKQWSLLVGGTVPTTGDMSVTHLGDEYPMVRRHCVALRGWSSTSSWPNANHAVETSTDVNAMRKRTGVLLDLPTEAQWEYACRGGTTTAYNNGTDGNSVGLLETSELSRIAVWNDNCPDGHYATVGTKDPNGYGLYDMIGNVAELCLDSRVTASGATFDPQKNDLVDPKGGEFYADRWNAKLVARGSNYTSKNSQYNWDGTYGADIYVHRSAYRGDAWIGGGTANQWLGFRLTAPVGRAWPLLNSEVSTTASQQAGSRVVKFKYDLEEDAIVTLKVKVDGVAVDGLTSSVGGDVNRLVKAGTGKLICWYPDDSLEGQEIASGKVSLELEKWSVENPPAYMALDLRNPKQTNILYFAEGEVLGGATNEMFKTDWLLMRRIPAKNVTWWMGIATNAYGYSVESGGYDTGRSKRHLVKLTEDYFIGVYPLTECQWRHLGGSVAADAARSTKPAVISYHDMRPAAGGVWPADKHAVDSGSGLGKLRKRSGGYQFDLPTDAQWEYACRALTGSAFCDGAASAYRNGNMLTNVTDYGWVKENAPASRMPVGLRWPNLFGLYDMHGNIWEWCVDFYSETYGLTSAQIAAAQTVPVENPVGPTGKAWSENHLLRGGSAASTYEYARSGDRALGFLYCVSTSLTGPGGQTGVRVVCPIAPITE